MTWAGAGKGEPWWGALWLEDALWTLALFRTPLFPPALQDLWADAGTPPHFWACVALSSLSSPSELTSPVSGASLAR